MVTTVALKSPVSVLMVKESIANNLGSRLRERTQTTSQEVTETQQHLQPAFRLQLTDRTQFLWIPLVSWPGGHTRGSSTRKLRLRCCCVESVRHQSGERRQWTNDLRIIGYQQVRLCKAKGLLLNSNQRVGAIDMSKAWTRSDNMSKIWRNLDTLEKHVQFMDMLF